MSASLEPRAQVLAAPERVQRAALAADTEVKTTPEAAALRDWARFRFPLAKAGAA